MKKEDLRPVKYDGYERDVPDSVVPEHETHYGWFHGYEKSQYREDHLVIEKVYALIEHEDGKVEKVPADDIQFIDRFKDKKMKG